MIVRLDNPRVWRTYTGGQRIAALHGMDAQETAAFGNHLPEEWIMSDVEANNGSRNGRSGEGLSHIPDRGGISLRSFVASDPERYLGRKHVSRFGATIGVLAKIIDSDERLTIQVHPTDAMARELFSAPFGKTESWYILGGDDPSVYIGFKENVTRERWEKLFWSQDVEGMLGCLHHYAVRPGDTVLVRGGFPHAIGKGALLMEIQEPSDLTIRVERTTPGGLAVEDILCHQGIGFEKMFDCFSYDGMDREATRKRVFLNPASHTDADGIARTHIIRYSDIPGFALEKLAVPAGLKTAYRLDGDFAGLYVLSGKGEVSCGNDVLSFGSGDQFFVTADSHGFSVASSLDARSELMIIHGPKC